MFFKLISTQPLHSRGLEQLSVVVKTAVAFYMVIAENTNKNNNNKKILLIMMLSKCFIDNMKT